MILRPLNADPISLTVSTYDFADLYSDSNFSFPVTTTCHFSSIISYLSHTIQILSNTYQSETSSRTVAQHLQYILQTKQDPNLENSLSQCYKIISLKITQRIEIYLVLLLSAVLTAKVLEMIQMKHEIQKNNSKIVA